MSTFKHSEGLHQLKEPWPENSRLARSPIRNVKPKPQLCTSICYMRERKELTGKYEMTIGALAAFEFPSCFPKELPFAFWLPESSETRDGDNGKKQLKTAEKDTIVLF